MHTAKLNEAKSTYLQNAAVVQRQPQCLIRNSSRTSQLMANPLSTSHITSNNMPNAAHTAEVGNAPVDIAAASSVRAKRKRSQKVGLVLMIPTASIWLAGCSDSRIMAEVFTSVAQCVAKGNTQLSCENEFAKAENRHVFLAPHYHSPEDCAADFTAAQCESVIPARNTGFVATGTLYRPKMAGMLTSEFIHTLTSHSNRQMLTTQPLYQASNDANRYRTSANCIIGTNDSLVQVTERSAQINAAGTVRRGGFGANASTRHCSASS